jgi:multiple sugar transport system ATP-binding protein
MRASLAQLHNRRGVTTVYVTHDQVEAMTLGQRVAVLRDGRVLQVDEPQRLYYQPRNLFVAAFIGAPAMNLVEARVEGEEIAFGQFRVPLDPQRRPVRDTTSVVLGIRPESFQDAAFAPPHLPTIEVGVEVVEEVGSDTHVFFPVAAPPITAESFEAGEDASLIVEEQALFSARVDPGTRASVGAPQRLALDPARFYFFDPATGDSLTGSASARAEDVPAALTQA